MDTKEYIASGILESYAMGLSSKQESKEVECLSSIYPEVKSELEKIELSLESYANSLALSPPDSVKQNILSAIKETEQEQVLRRVVGGANESLTAEKQQDAGKVVNMKTYLRLAVASVVFLVVGFAYVYNQMQSNYSSLQGELTSYKKETNHYIDAMKDSLGSTAAEREFFLHQNTKTLLLAGTELSPESKVRIFWNNQIQEYVLQYDQLPPAGKGKQYQLWAIADGQPVDMGVLNKETQVTDKKTAPLKNIQAFAITLEQEGGNEVPTLEAMYVVGNV